MREGRVETPRLDLQDVSFALDGTRVLDSVSWTVAPDEHWALLGPNGAGKTTLLKIACGFLWPNAGGRVLWNGKPDANLGDLRRGIGWLTSTLVDEVPKRERVLDTVISGKYAQVGLWAFAWEPPCAADVERAMGYLGALGCEALAGRQFGSLSQGEQQKVLICRAWMAEPYLTILDEPCAGMDPGARESFLSSLLSLGRTTRHPSFMYVTHHVEEILPIFTKTLILKEGRVVQKGDTSEVISDRTISELYGLSMHLVKRNERYWPVPM